MGTRTRLLLVTLVIAWLRLEGVGAAYPLHCENRCTSSADCNDLCYLSAADFMNGIDSTCYNYGVYGSCSPPPPTGNGGPGTGLCGDGTCDANETCDSCPKDCASGGNNGGGTQCQPCGEEEGCGADKYGGAGSGNPPQCGPSEEWCSFCPEDCGACDDGYCWPQVCGGEDQQFQCKPCDSDNQCNIAGYGDGAWCAIEEGQCNTYCYVNADCPNSWQWYCDGGGACVKIS